MSKHSAAKPRAPQTAPAPVPSSAGTWRGHLWPAAALWLATLAAYSNSFGAALVFDNAAILLKDPRITAATARNLQLIWTTEYWYPRVGNGLFRPLTTLSYLMNYAVFGNGPQPAGYHWVNYLLHAAAATLVYLLGLAVFRRMGPALAMAALWALHPVLTESVTNVVGRADILSAIGVLAALLCHIRASSAEGRRKWQWLGGVALATAVAIFSKESGAVVLALALLYDLAFPSGRAWRAKLAGYGAMAAAGLAYLAVRPSMATPHFPFTDNPITGAGFIAAKLTALKVIGKYLALLVWPARLSCDYSYNAIPLVGGDMGRWENLQALLALAACLGALGLAIYGWRRAAGSPRKSPAAGAALFFFVMFFFAALAPTSNLALTFGTIMAERLLYLPAVGFAGCLVLAVYGAAARFAPTRRMAAPAVMTVLCLALGLRTWSRNLDWQTERDLWSSAVAAVPGSYKAHQTYAGTLPLLDQTLPEIDRALAILAPLPDRLSTSVPYINAGGWYRQKGDSLARSDQAQRAAWYQKSRDVLEHAGRIQQATGHIYEEIHQELGLTYLRTGDYRRAADELGVAVRLRPQASLLESLSVAYYQAGDLRNAEVTLLQGLVLDANNTRFVTLLINFYGHTDPGSCAVQTSGGSSNLNANCPLVHAQLCAAAGRLAEAYAGGNRPDLASDVRARMVGSYGCPAP